MAIVTGAALAAVALACLAGCGRSGGTGLHDTLAANPGLSLPPLPVDKASSRTYGATFPGTDTFERGGVVNEVGETLELLAGMDSVSYAVYRLNPGLEHISQVEVSIVVVAELQTYVAVADYSQGLWDIQGPVTGNTTLNLSDSWHRTAGGNYYIAVITAGGSARVVELNATIDNGWEVITVDAAGSNGIESINTSLAVIGGKPAIAYFAGAGQDLKYAYSSTAFGNNPSDWTTETIDSDGRVGEHCSLANVNGVPGVSYRDYSNGNLKYARRMPDNTWRTTTVDNTGEVGGFTSLAVVSGKPCISYYAGLGGSLWYARSSSDYGIEDGIVIWPRVEVDDAPEFVGIGTSIAEIDGTPAIAYYDISDFRLKYARSTQADGLNDRNWDIMAFDNGGGGMGLAPILGVANGNPVLVYTDYNTGTTRFRRSNNINGIDPPNWASPVSFDADTEYSGYDTSHATIGGYPAVAYRDRNTKELKYALSSTLNGTSADDWQSIVVESGGNPGHYCSLADLGARPAISFFDRDSGDLKYAVYTGP